MRNLKPLVWLSAIVLIVALVIVTACTPKTTEPTGKTDTPEATSTAFELYTGTLPTPNDKGVITADQWKDIYPDIYESFMMNEQNTVNPSYLDQYDFLAVIYDGTGFGKSYNEARGHPFTLQDVANTGRPHALANCLTCKSPEFTALVVKDGVGVYSREFDEVYALLDQSISCYNCHANTNGDLVVSADFLNNALGADKASLDPVDIACGQCHNEYYFDPETKATTLPWSGVSKMNPDDMLAYYNDINFTDFVNNVSGANMIKIQHPEMETILGAGSKVPSMTPNNCADCHMGTATNSDGKEYPSHYLLSPLKNPALIDSTCKSCHQDLAAEVAAIQKDTKDRLVVIGNKLADLHKKIGAAADAGKTDEELAGARQSVRDAQFYYDFVFVENSDGAHNSALTKHCLDQAEQIADAALAAL